MRRVGTDDIDLPSGYEVLKLDSRVSIALPASVARASRQALAERESAMNEARREELRRSHVEAKETAAESKREGEAQAASQLAAWTSSVSCWQYADAADHANWSGSSTAMNRTSSRDMVRKYRGGTQRAVRRSRNPLNTTMRLAPMSAKTAIHRVACPASARTRNTALMPRASTMF